MTWHSNVRSAALFMLAIATPAFAQATNGTLPKAEGPDILVIGFSLGTLLLLAALIYGVTRYNQRDRRKEPMTEEATRRSTANPTPKPQWARYERSPLIANVMDEQGAAAAVEA